MNQEEVVLKKTSLINPLISVNIVQKSEKFEDDLKQDLVRDLLTDKAMDENNYSYRQDRRGGVNYGSETVNSFALKKFRDLILLVWLSLEILVYNFNFGLKLVYSS